MKGLKTKMEEMARKAVQHAVRDELEEWPPQTLLLFYQPERPEKPQEKTEE